MIRFGICKGTCGKTRSVPIVNRRYGLCNDCNRKRLGSSDCVTKMKSKGIKRGLSDKAKEEIRLDEEFYEKVWNEKPHYCEETGEFLGDEFRDSNGKVIDRFRFSHIIPKGREKSLRRHPLNINLLNLESHNKWEHGNQESMKIYPENKKKIDIMYKELYGQKATL